MLVVTKKRDLCHCICFQSWLINATWVQGSEQSCRQDPRYPDSLFCDLPSEVMAVFDSIKSVTHFLRGTTLFQEGQKARGVFVVCTGRVRLSVCSASGKRIILGTAAPKEVLGLSASLSNSPHEVTAEALEDADVAVVSRKDLLRFLHSHCEACLQVMQVLSYDLHVAYDRLRAIGLRRRRRAPKARGPV